jgi:membrane protein required for colicin V production
MHWLDIIILVIVAGATFIGLKNGLIKAALFLVGVILGVFLAGRFYVPLSEQLTFIEQEGLARAAAFAIILIATMIVANLTALFLKWFAKIAMLGWVNHLGGAVFGLLLGAVFCGALLAVWTKYLGATNIVSQSFLAPVLLQYFPAVLAFLPEEFDSIRSFF